MASSIDQKKNKIMGKISAEKNFTTVTGYIMDLIKKDMKKNAIDKRG